MMGLCRVTIHYSSLFSERDSGVGGVSPVQYLYLKQYLYKQFCRVLLCETEKGLTMGFLIESLCLGFFGIENGGRKEQQSWRATVKLHKIQELSTVPGIEWPLT